jgi:hypothetical protein
VGALERHGLVVDTIAHRDFLHPATPALAVPLVDGIGRLLELTPLLRRISGSLWVCGRRPAA